MPNSAGFGPSAAPGIPSAEPQSRNREPGADHEQPEQPGVVSIRKALTGMRPEHGPEDDRVEENKDPAQQRNGPPRPPWWNGPNPATPKVVLPGVDHADPPIPRRDKALPAARGLGAPEATVHVTRCLSSHSVLSKSSFQMVLFAFRTKKPAAEPTLSSSPSAMGTAFSVGTLQDAEFKGGGASKAETEATRNPRMKTENSRTPCFLVFISEPPFPGRAIRLPAAASGSGDTEGCAAYKPTCLSAAITASATMLERELSLGGKPLYPGRCPLCRTELSGGRKSRLPREFSTSCVKCDGGPTP